MARAQGAFDVSLQPVPTAHNAEGSPLGRMSIDKQYYEDLDATGELVGLAGTMMINIAAGAHSYDFDYTLAEP